MEAESAQSASSVPGQSAAEPDGDLPGGFLREAARDSAATPNANSSEADDNTTPPSSPPKAAEASSSSPTSPMLSADREARTMPSRRVKVYRLKGETWEDLGTGWCNVHTDRPPMESKPEVLVSDLDLSIAGDDEDAGPWITVMPESADAASTSSDDADELLADVKGKGKAAPVREIWRTAMRNVMALSAADTEQRGGYARQQG